MVCEGDLVVFRIRELEVKQVMIIGGIPQPVEVLSQ